jgi:hypothetical protein
MTEDHSSPENADLYARYLEVLGHLQKAWGDHGGNAKINNHMLLILEEAGGVIHAQQRRDPSLAGAGAKGALDWAVSRWNAEVKNRPLVNVHRRSLDTTWRQVIRYLGGDDEGLCGPPHDELASASSSPDGSRPSTSRWLLFCRDASRLYAGPHPVVAHPPCQRWGKLWAGQPLWIKRTGIRKIKGDDDGCFASALAAVRKWGGILEHPWGVARMAAFRAEPAAARWWMDHRRLRGRMDVLRRAGALWSLRPQADAAVSLTDVDLPSLRWGKGEPRLDPAVSSAWGSSGRSGWVRSAPGAAARIAALALERRPNFAIC